MAEIGEPEKRRVLIPQTVPTENPYPYSEPPQVKPEAEPIEKVPA